MLNTRLQREQIPQRIFDAVPIAGWWLARTIAPRARVHLSCAQKHLKRFAERGLLERGKAKGQRHKPIYAYRRKVA